MPVLHLLAGPNGAGKSTYVRDVLVPATGLPFVNADVIAARESFITETVFSHPSKIALVADASALGYLVHLHVVMVPVELSVQRVADRVRDGGHDVPESKIRERHDRLWGFVANAVRIADAAEVFDNSSARHPFRLCATFVHGVPAGPTAWPRWTPSAFTG